MAQISILSGITTDARADWRTSLPVNAVPVPKDTGISKGYLRVAPGLTQFATGSGVDRGSIEWNGVNYRVSGTSLIRVNADGTVTVIGAISGSGPVSMDYGPTYLQIVGDLKAWLYDGTTLTQIVDADLGPVIDGWWVDGYGMYTDGTYVIVSELANPFSIDPLKYGSSEADPDPIMGGLKLKDEVRIFNRYTIETFQNTGGTGFPFSRISSAVIETGCVGTKAKTKFAKSIAWVGSGRNEPVSVYMLSGGAETKIATREVEKRLKAYTETQLSAIEVEARADESHQHLLVHLPGETLVYDHAASVALQEPVWFFLSTGTTGPAAYRARHFTWCYGKWLCGDTSDGRIGYVDESVITQYGEVAGGQFDTMFLYNENRGAIVWSLTLIGTTGRAPDGDDPVIFHSYTLDGQKWSQERMVRIGKAGDTGQRVQVRRLGQMQQMRSDRFRWANKTPVSWSRLEAELEALNA